MSRFGGLERLFFCWAGAKSASGTSRRFLGVTLLTSFERLLSFESFLALGAFFDVTLEDEA